MVVIVKGQNVPWGDVYQHPNLARRCKVMEAVVMDILAKNRVA